MAEASIVFPTCKLDPPCILTGGFLWLTAIGAIYDDRLNLLIFELLVETV